jgi:hypothetical protein
MQFPNRIDVHIHFHSDEGQVLTALDAIATKLDNLIKKEETDMANVQKDIVSLTAQVAQNTSVEESAVTLINGIAAQLAAAIAAGNPAALDALQAQLAASASDLGAAITANTPAAPPAAAH